MKKSLNAIFGALLMCGAISGRFAGTVFGGGNDEIWKFCRSGVKYVPVRLKRVKHGNKFAFIKQKKVGRKWINQ